MAKKTGTTDIPLQWLVEPEDPGVRYLALRDLVKTGETELTAARRAAHSSGPIANVLAKMKKEGYWEKPGAGYYPKYTGTVWSIILLSQLGGSIEMDERIARACGYVLDHALTKDGHFTVNGMASGTADCLQGNLCAALTDLGCEDPRLDQAFEWMARSVTGEGVAPMQDKTAAVRYYAGKCGPSFACGSNNKQPCAWGGVKVMLALGKLPKKKKTQLIKTAIQTGVDFMLSHDPALADYPCGYSSKPSRNWWKFGFPMFYVTDLLQNVEAMKALGYGDDPRLAHALDTIQEKRGASGCWSMEYDYTGKTWVDFGPKGHPNKWVTWRAARALKASR